MSFPQAFARTDLAMDAGQGAGGHGPVGHKGHGWRVRGRRFPLDEMGGGRKARLRLAAAGVTQVSGGGLCTVADTRRFYSYRRDGETGRMAALVWLAGLS